MEVSIPSSPPSLPDEAFDEPPSSPPLLPQPFPTRKRHADYESSLSSDPIFSEDASEESDPNGGLFKKKKKYTKGPWFRHREAPLLPFQRVKAEGSMHKDSGVWMGSDSSNDSISGCDKRVQSLSFQDFTVKRAPAIAPAAKARTPQDIAAELVFRCVEAGQQSIDLSEMQLETIPNHVLRPLHQLIRLPFDQNDPSKVTSELYAPFTPEIKMFLAKNGLVSLPTELWNLSNITVLSMRNNDLTHLSPSVARLRNLQELNIAGNQFRYLPWELLSLILPTSRKLQRLSLSPNPFLQPLGDRPSLMLSRFRVSATVEECAQKCRKLRSRSSEAARSVPSYEALLLRLHESHLQQMVCDSESSESNPNQIVDTARPIYVASSKITFLDFDGSVLRSPTSSFGSQSVPEEDHTASLAPVQFPTTSHPISTTPSLFELAARSCARSSFIAQLSSLLPDDASPPVTRALSSAIETKEVGMPCCSVCGVRYVIPRARWVEYWFDGGSGVQFLPFLRKACSWGCVRGVVREREEGLERVRGVLEGAVGEGWGMDVDVNEDEEW